MKTCSKCCTSKQAEEFSKNRSNRDGLQQYCKTCVKISAAKWYVANSEKSDAATAAWKKANREKVSARKAASYKANLDKNKARMAAWYKANSEKVNAKSVARQKAHPEIYRIISQNRRSRKILNGGKLSKDIAKRLYRLQKGKCPCCKLPLGDDYHMDHIMPISKGGANEDWNIQLLRKTCNLQKNSKHPIDFMQQRGFLL